MNQQAFKFNFYFKAMKDIASCETIEHLEITKNWIQGVFKNVLKINFWMAEAPNGQWFPGNYDFLYNIYTFDSTDKGLRGIREIITNELVKKWNEINNM